MMFFCKSSKKIVAGKTIFTIMLIFFCLTLIPVAADEKKEISLYQQGIDSYKKKKYKNAQKYLIQAVESGKISKEQLGSAFIVLGRIETVTRRKQNPPRDFNKAYYYFNKAVETRPDYKWSYFWRSKILNELGRLDEALEDADKLLSMEKTDNNFFMRAKIYENMSEYDSALKDMDKALKIRPDASNYYYRRAKMHCLAGNFEQAFSDIKRAYDEGIAEGLYHIERGRTFFVMGHFDRAIGEFAYTDQIADTYDPAKKQILKARGLYYILKTEYKIAQDDFVRFVSNSLNQKLNNHAQEYLAWLKWLSMKSDEDFLYRTEKWVKTLKPDSWTQKMIDFFDDKVDESTMLEFANSLSNTNDRTRLMGYTKYLVAQKRLEDGNKKGAMVLLQSIIQSSSNQMIGTLAESDIRRIKKLPPRMAKMLPLNIEQKLPLMARHDEDRTKLWEWVIEPAFSDFIGFDRDNLFKGKLLSVKRDMGYEIINSVGDILYSKKKRSIGVDDQGLFFKYFENHCEYMNNKNQVVLQSKFKPYSPFNGKGIRICKQKDQTILLDMNDKIIAKGNFIHNTEGMFSVKEGKLTGYANEKGEMITQVKFKKAGNFSQGYASVSEDGKNFYFIDKTGKRIFDKPFMSGPAQFHNGFARIKFWKNRKQVTGLIDPKGKLISNKTFKKCNHFDSQGYARVQTHKGKRGFIDKKGNWALSPPALLKPYKYDDLYTFKLSPKRGGKYSKTGLMDSRGNVVVPAQFRFIKRVSGSVKRGWHYSQTGFTKKEAHLLALTPLLPVSISKNPIWGYIKLRDSQ